MEHLLEEFLVNEDTWLRGFVFGFVHVSIMLVGYYSGWSLNRLLKIISNGYVAGIIGAAFSHVFADIIAASLDPHIRSSTIGIALGGMLPLVFIPILEKFLVKSEHHIMIGDHEDIRKDLDAH